MIALYHASAWLYALFAVQHVGLAIGHPDEREHWTMACFGAGLFGYVLASASYYDAPNAAAAVGPQRWLAVTACIAGISFLMFLARLVPQTASKFGWGTYGVLLAAILFGLSGAACDPGRGPLWHGAFDSKSSVTPLGAVALSLAFGSMAFAVSRSLRGRATQVDARTMQVGGAIVLFGSFFDLLAGLGVTTLPPVFGLTGGVMLLGVGRVLTRRSSSAEEALGRRQLELHNALETLESTREFIAKAASAASVGTAAAQVAEQLREPVLRLEMAARDVARDEAATPELLKHVDRSIEDLNALVSALTRGAPLSRRD